ncbi:MAG: hypothetical protein GX976_01725 [Bacteroidales bacterium]|jgi:hypothetical protein|nr:hypothetical protein [Bacteroidales bacterium]
MEFVDILLKRFDGDSELRKATNALVCFSSPETGKKLAQLTYQMVMTRSEGSSMALLYFINSNQEEMTPEEMSRLQSKISSDFMPKSEKEKITLRTFISDEEKHMVQIGKMIEEQGSNLMIRGISSHELSISQVELYSQLRRDPANPVQNILMQFPARESEILQELTAMMGDNRIPTALFIDNNMQEAKKIFMPLLCDSDIHLFTYLYHLAQPEGMEIMVWDAIGIIDTEPRIQRVFQYILKKSDGKVHLWNNVRKIEESFIQKQDLIVTGVGGWSRLTNTPLPWKEQLPSLLIIKEGNR